MLLYPYINIHICLIIDLAKLIIFKLIAYYFVGPKYGNGQIIYCKLIHTFQQDSGGRNYLNWVCPKCNHKYWNNHYIIIFFLHSNVIFNFYSFTPSHLFCLWSAIGYWTDEKETYLEGKSYINPIYDIFSWDMFIL